MNFKEAVQKDIVSVFLNHEEFADEHVLNDRNVVCLVDKDMTSPATQSLEGVFMNAVTIYVKSDDMERQPVENELLFLDGAMYIVRSVSVEMGVLVIVAEVHNQ